MGVLDGFLVCHLSGLNLDSLVHQCGEVGEVMNSKCKLEVWVESITEFLLSTSISGYVFFSIAGQFKEFTLISFDSFIALSKVAKLCFLPVHDSLRNVAGTESSLKLDPGDDCPSR